MTVTTRPAFTVILLNWNGRAYLEACLTALEAQTHPPHRVAFVDNASTDDSVAFVRERFPAVEVRQNGGNLGFAAGNNAALREWLADEAAGDAVLLLNPDVILSPDCLAALGEALAADPTIGIAGCKLWYPDGSTLQHAGGFITHPQAMPGHFGVSEDDAGQHDAARDVDYVIGAALTIRRDTLARIGLLDEGFFLYYEDGDLCARAWRAGFRVVYEPRATAVHVESAVAIKGSFAYLQRFHAGRWRYLLKHFPAAEITADTLPAELAWLDRIAEDERRAVSLAYLATTHALPDIRTARDAYDPIDGDAWATIEQGLHDLRARALATTTDAGGLARLAAAALLVERPFTSEVPVLGPLIARFRSAWNDVASRWYVHHLVEQQNAFNALAVEQLALYEMELQEQLALLEEQLVEQEALRRRVQELAAELAALKREIGRSGA